ncbi:aldehyde dehydrogenase family protein [Nitriliruptor alkaliphilus]|uniref:aldehyde dehydrogenase family protein n=1 Tax=Nitriliruptor alkaliphilus TaxID=427918 RepID=UPI000698EB28|nr:aldehyde dehydrogenase family protein [Nitriliruptor alkaliphilus]
MRGLYIDGSWRTNDTERRPVTDPGTGEVIDRAVEASVGDVRAAIAAARSAFDDGGWSYTDPARRAEVLRGLAAGLVRDRDEVARLETLDTGKTVAESHADIEDSVAVLRYYAEIGAGEAPGAIALPRPSVTSIVTREPVGVCALICPWNYPLLQLTWKLAPALVAGNTIVAKPSELTPLTTSKLFELLDELDLPAGVANLVLGAGQPVGHELVASPDVDLVSFTGGLVTGKMVMREAAVNVKRVALELGGKNPNIVFADADIDAAVDNALTAAFVHAGQVCSAGARLMVEAPLHDRFVDALVDRAAKIRLGNGFDDATQMGPVISAAHRDKVDGHVQRGVAEGATLALGGRPPDDDHLQGGFFYLPTVLVDCDDDLNVVREEIFGPVVTVERFATEDEVVRRANATIYGLAGAVWTADADRARAVARALRLGTVWINDYHPYLPHAEWGGFKQSGSGRELGRLGLEEYCETKHVYRNESPAPTGWFDG